MKIVVNTCFGGFSCDREWAKTHGFDYYGLDYRTNEILIKAIENREKVSGTAARLSICVIPDDVTDWEINEYDGYEHIIAVIDGKIKHFYAED